MKAVYEDMRIEIKETIHDMASYFVGSFLFLQPVVSFLFIIGNGICWILFPHGAYITQAAINGSLVILDLITKQYAIVKSNGGLTNAIKERKLSSNQLWLGTRKKVVSYMLVLTLVGLSARFGFPTIMGIIGSTVYALMFIRESFSIAENMQEAGHDMTLILGVLRKSEQQLNQNIEDQTSTKDTTKD